MSSWSTDETETGGAPSSKRIKDLRVKDALDLSQDLITIKCDVNLETALHVLEVKHISCVPVVDLLDRVHRFVDILDLVTFVMILDEHSPLCKSDFASMLAKEKYFTTTPVSKVTDLSKRNKFCPVLGKI